MRVKEEEFGVKHLLLCRVILGNTEKIAAGSRQFQPSSTDFDSGVDNPLSPLQYTIWSAYMNSHIFPIFIISFTAPSLTVCRTSKFPNSPGVEFSVLMNVLSRFLNPSQMTLILKCYNEFQEKKIGRPHLITRWRSLVGDKVLLLAIRMCGIRPT
ncbi:probable inactive poly [ADP-ribose] polymerase SRO2 [Salvia splendens]|uniref:probable inactive poly [ADP-ribose] polymerase SRO2 n=1 Tax=Salvia splendens TaxID=180675 RepID=UPI001C27F071|nr:probable inactive poly [ADP-ribose] polymerase SRO2 [Salvia splendens]